MKKLIALFCMFMVAMLPFNVYALEEVEQAEKTTRAVGQEAKELGFRIDTDAKFEDILVQIDSYQPKVLRAGLLEEQPVNVYASLIGVPVNPTIEIPEITSISTNIVNVSWKPLNTTGVRIGAVSYIPPAQGFISYRNLGYLSIQIPQIAKEHDVPDEIIVDMAAKIGFKISETLTFTKKDLSMPALTSQEWISQKDQYSFFGGYIRAEQIGENNAVFIISDNNNLISRPITVSEGATSGVLTVPGIEPGARSFNKFRLRLNKIRGMEDEVSLIVSNPEAQVVKLVKGDPLYFGSEWIVQDISINEDSGNIKFKNQAGRPPKDVPFKFDGKNVNASEEDLRLKSKEKQFDAFLVTARLNLIENPKVLDAYANAVATYEKVVQEGNRVIGSGEYSVYSGGNPAVDAQRQIYEIYKKLGFGEKQIDAGRKLLDEYTNVKDRELINEELRALGDRSNVADRTIILPESTGEIRVTISNVHKTTDEPKATIIDHSNGVEIEVVKGGVIDLEEGLKLRVKEISINSVNLELLDKDGKLIKLIQVTKNRGANIGSTKHSLQLIKLDFKKIVYLSVIPEPKQANADTNFKLHIPIEKRQIGLPLFSKTLDKEINKTAKLIERLDKYIDQVEKLHKFWTNLCLITFATMWAKNILRGLFGSTALVRDRVNSEWKQKYSDEQARGYKGSYDQYVLDNSEKYNKDYDNVKKILDEIDKGQYKTVEGVKNIKSEESETFKKDYYYAYRKAQIDPGNEIAVKQYISNGLAAEKIEVDESISGVQKKDWSALNNEEKAKFTGTMDNNAAFRNQRTDKKDDERYAALWDNQQTRAEVLAVYRRDNVRSAESSYLSEGYKEDLTRIKADPVKYNNYINSLKQSSDSQFTSETISINEIEKKEDGYYTTGGTKIEGNVTVGGSVKINNENVKIIAVGESTANHRGQLNVYNTGRDSGRLQRVSIDATRYAEIKYSTGGRVESMEIYERPVANGNMGGKDDKRLGEAAAMQATTNDAKLKSSLSQVASCVSGVNTQLSKQKVQSGYNVNLASTVGCSLGRYVVSRPAQTSTGPSCVEYMDPGDCKLLFNACDPVVCPASRCNLDGRWQVDNVVQTGIIGSAFLCAPNWVVFGGDVVMPVCLTGILAGLQNIKSILQGYNQCLKKSQLEDTSVGICDRLRSYYLCEILWREASALLNTKQGVLGLLVDKVSGTKKGGDEYSQGAGVVDDSVGAISYFTESYAKNVFAGYGGAGFTEAGVEICKAAVFGKAPKIGEFLDTVSKPESPPQFTAFFDATPYSDVARKDSLYTIFYHIYAGENEDLTYSVVLRGVPAPGQLVLQPATIIANKLIKAGEFSSENLERVLPTGFSEICIVTTTKNYGTKQECGPGKVTTEFALDWLCEQYVKNQATTRIYSEKECGPEDYSILGQAASQGVPATL